MPTERTSQQIDISAPGDLSSPRRLVLMDDSLYFTTYTWEPIERTQTIDLWRVDASDELSVAPGTTNIGDFSDTYAFVDRLIFSTRVESFPTNVHIWEPVPGNLPVMVAERAAEFRTILHSYQVLDGIVYFELGRDEVWSYDGDDPARRIAELDNITTSCNGEIYSTAFADRLLLEAFDPTTGATREVFRTNDEPYLLEFIDFYEDALLIATRDDLWRVDGMSPPDRVAARTSSFHNFNGTTYRDNVYYGRHENEEEELWAFDGRRFREVSVASPGFGCYDLEYPD